MNENSSDRRGLHLALGFATTVVMWAIGYVAMMRPGMVAGEILFGAMFVALFLGGLIAGRLTPTSGRADGARAGIKIGLVSATVNLLVVGSLFGRDTGSDLWVQLAIWVGGLYAASLICAAIGGAVGGGGSRWQSKFPATALFGAITAATIFLLLVTGGLVTGLEAGLAVPDWPNSFGHNMLLYPISQMKGGVYYEHAHRLYGMLVGLSAITLLTLVARFESGRLVRTLAVIGFLMVCVQGLMGGLRVTGHITLSQDAVNLAPSVPLAVAHGVFGQMVFATFCLIAVLCGRRWKGDFVPLDGAASKGRALSAALVVILLMQLISGAMYRHYQIPVLDGPPTYPKWAMHLHLTWAAVALISTLMVGMRAMSIPKFLRPIPQLGHGILMLVGIQVAFGIGALVLVITRKTAEIPISEVVFTSLHQSTGALLLATSVMIAAWWRRLTVSASAASSVLPTSTVAQA